MKSSRALLFAALMTVSAPFFANDANKPGTEQTNPPASTTPPATTPPATTTPTTEPGIFSKIGNGLFSIVAFPIATAPDYISSITLHKIASMACLKDGNVAAVLNNPWTGRVAVWAAVIALYLQVKKLQAQDDNNDQQMLFENDSE